MNRILSTIWFAHLSIIDSLSSNDSIAWLIVEVFFAHWQCFVSAVERFPKQPPQTHKHNPNNWRQTPVLVVALNLFHFSTSTTGHYGHSSATWYKLCILGGVIPRNQPQQHSLKKATVPPPQRQCWRVCKIMLACTRSEEVTHREGRETNLVPDWSDRVRRQFVELRSGGNRTSWSRNF